MSGPSEWVVLPAITPVLCRRQCRRFFLYARTDGRWEVEAIGEIFGFGREQDLATAKRAAEDALRRLLSEAMDALEALGT